MCFYQASGKGSWVVAQDWIFYLFLSLHSTWSMDPATYLCYPRSEKIWQYGLVGVMPDLAPFFSWELRNYLVIPGFSEAQVRRSHPPVVWQNFWCCIASFRCLSAESALSSWSCAGGWFRLPVDTSSFVLSSVGSLFSAAYSAVISPLIERWYCNKRMLVSFIFPAC